MVSFVVIILSVALWFDAAAPQPTGDLLNGLLNLQLLGQDANANPALLNLGLPNGDGNGCNCNNGENTGNNQGNAGENNGGLLDLGDLLGSLLGGGDNGGNNAGNTGGNNGGDEGLLGGLLGTLLGGLLGGGNTGNNNGNGNDANCNPTTEQGIVSNLLQELL